MKSNGARFHFQQEIGLDPVGQLGCVNIVNRISYDLKIE